MRYYLLINVLLLSLFTASCKKEVSSNSNELISPPVTGGGTGTVTSPVIPNGSFKLVASWQVNYPFTLCIIPYKVTIGAGYTSNEVNSNTFFSTKIYKESIPIISGGVAIGQSANLEVADLKPGIYYYKAVKESNGCTARGQTPKTVEMKGSFTVKSSQTVVVNINLN